MKHAYLFAYLILFHLLMSLTYAATGPELATILNSMHSMQANFKQTIYDNHGNVAQVSSGKMYLQRPGKFRWQVDAPIPQIIIANNQKLWIYDPDLEQVTIRFLNNSQSETPALLLSHVRADLNNKFAFHNLPSKKTDWHWYELIPRQKDSMFALVKLGFYQNQIKTMQLQDQLGHHSTIQFSNIKMNQAIAETYFSLKIPRNVDVIDETQSAR